ncbi:MAG: ribonuclease HII [Nitrospira sp.]|nr:ribonuclease HII [bacterium]MBL7049968.1 ribonuclease HII [Nitrospira sp.]
MPLTNLCAENIFAYDDKVREVYSSVAGLDEAGRGPLAGPVVAAAVVLPRDIHIEGLIDSKKTTEKQRRRLFWEINRKALAIGVGIVGAEIIDRINILQATKTAMSIAIGDLGVRLDILLIDAVKLTDIRIRQFSMFKGESVSASIAAASIIAKVVRDDIMCDCHARYPQYNFRSHKGYGTKDHMLRLSQYGPAPMHRKSFRPVSDYSIPEHS